jgi:DNA repair exonuclease SbcCD nuclease subunit
VPRLLHTSDVHVGEWSATSELATPVDALRTVVDTAIRERVDLVLFAGDLFDSNRVPQPICDQVCVELSRLPVPSVILPGNHDPYDAESVYRRLRLPSPVRLVTERGGETVRFESLDLAVWGRPHLSYAENLQPLLDPPEPDNASWQVAIGHGHLVRTPDDLMRSYLIHADQIAACRRHYVALGHWDVHHDVSQGEVTAVYSGSPSRKGVAALVDLERTDGRVRARVVRAAV